MRRASNTAEEQEVVEQAPRSERRRRATKNADEHKSFILAMADALRDILRDESR